jgi:hypothetical protein
VKHVNLSKLIPLLTTLAVVAAFVGRLKPVYGLGFYSG